jgi:hypothetical protein
MNGDAVASSGAKKPCNTADPLLLIDIDGVLSLFGFASSERPPGDWIQADGWPHLISAGARAYLHELAGFFELAWCSGWEERANDHLPGLLGLTGPLPHLSFDRNPGRGHAHWKLAAIEDYAGEQRPLAWIDDALNEACEEWAAAREGPTLLVRTQPAIGLTAEHVEQLVAWARVQGA